MKLVAISRMLNEEDIIEAFIRHHAPLIDHHVLLDFGSTDRSLEILAALRAEGFSLSVLQTTAANYADTELLTALLRLAAGSFGADWVLCLECDEFIDTRFARGDLRGMLESRAPETVAVKIEQVTYIDSDQDDPAELVVPLRLRRRVVGRTRLYKVMINTARVNAPIIVGPGGRFVHIDGAEPPVEDAGDLWLAQYPRRNGWQEAARAVAERARVLANGSVWAASTINAEYNEVYDLLRLRPEEFLGSARRMGAGDLNRGDVVADPIAYLGGDLRYTEAADPRMGAMRTILAALHGIATQHGRLLEENAALRTQVAQWNMGMNALI